MIHQKRISEIERTKQNAEEDQQFKTSQIPSKQVKTCGVNNLKHHTVYQLKQVKILFIYFKELRKQDNI